MLDHTSGTMYTENASPEQISNEELWRISNPSSIDQIIKKRKFRLGYIL